MISHWLRSTVIFNELRDIIDYFVFVFYHQFFFHFRGRLRSGGYKWRSEHPAKIKQPIEDDFLCSLFSYFYILKCVFSLEGGSKNDPVVAQF